jgi:ATP-dependent protease Clp ATPase subunit
MNKLTKEDLSLILRKSKLSIFKRYQRELNQKGITLFFDPKLFDKIAEESLSLDTGARELSNTVNFIFENIIYEVLANPGKYTQCQLELDIVHDNTKFKLS